MSGMQEIPEDEPDDARRLRYKRYQMINQKIPDDIGLQKNI
jgi:hypothetical protein